MLGMAVIMAVCVIALVMILNAPTYVSGEMKSILIILDLVFMAMAGIVTAFSFK
jgi:hypothetical protein